MKEAIILDISKINSYVFPNIDKAYDTMQNSYNNAVNLKNNLPSSFSYKSTVSDIVNKINTLKSDINKVEKKLKVKVEQVEKIEKKNDSQINKIIRKASALDILMPDINKINTGAKTSKFKGDVVDKNVGKTVKKNIFKTGAVIAKGIVSKLKKTKTNIINKMKFVGTKVYKGVKTVLNKISKSAKVTTDWIKKKFNETSEMLKSTGAYISEKVEVVKSYIADKWARRDEIIKRLGAGVVTTAVSLTKGIVKVVESFGDLLVILTSGLRTIKSAILDIINGIFKNKWDWKNTKEIWDTTKGVVSTDWTNMVYDSLYKTKALSRLNDLAYTPFKKDGIACQITEGIGYVAGIIGLTIATGGLGLGASLPQGASMAIMSGLSGFGKYTEEEWNKNVLSINYLGEDLELKINYDKYKEISKLNPGESTTVVQEFTLEDGSIKQLVFNITKNEDGTYTIVDNVGNAVTLNEIKESSTVRGLGVGLVKGAWEAGQWYVGSKIGTGEYSNITSKFKDPIQSVLARTGIRVGLDSLTAAVEVPFQSVVTMVSEGKTFEEAWEEQGGWTSVISQVAIGALASTGGEIFDIRKVTKSVKLINALESGNIDDALNKKLSKLRGEKLKVFLETADEKGNFDFIVSKLDSNQMDDFIKYLDSTKDIDFLNKFNDSKERNLIFEIENSDNPKLVLSKLNNKILDRVYENVSASNKEIIDNFKKINDVNFDNLSKLLKNESLINEYRVEILDIIIKKQNYIFNDIKYSSSNECLVKLINDDLNFYKKLSNENLIRFFPYNNSSGVLLDEIKNRIKSGENLFLIVPKVRKFYGLINTDLGDVAKKIDSLSDSILEEMYFDVIKYIPKKYKNIDFGQISPIGKEMVLANLFKNNRIDDRGIKFIDDLYKRNINSFKSFNVELLDKDILNILDNDFIKEVGLYDDLSFKLITLYKENKEYLVMLNDFVKNSKVDDSLNVFYVKSKIYLNYLYENMYNDNSYSFNDGFINYILYKDRRKYSSYSTVDQLYKINYSESFWKDFRLKCDELFSETYNKWLNINDISYNGHYEIDDAKELFFEKYFNLRIGDVEDIIFKYYDDIDNVLKYDENLETSTIIKFIEKVYKSKDMNYINGLYDTLDFYMTSEELLIFETNLKRLYSSSYVDALSTTDKTIKSLNNYSFVKYNGKNIKIIDMNDEFSLLVHSNGTNFTSLKKILVNDNYIDDWYNIDNPQTHGLATSYISSSNVGCCPVNEKGILYGFTEVDVDDIAIMAPYDVNSRIADYGFGSGNKQKYLSVDSMSNYSLRVYNEVVVERSRVKPNYIIIFDDSSQNVIDNSLKAASEWDIPILKIDKKKLAKDQMIKIDNFINQFKVDEDISKLKKSIELFESNVSGYKLNSYVKDGEKDVTEVINNEYLRDLFNKDNLEKTIIDYINTSSSVFKIEEVIDILKEIKYRYEVVNENGTKVIANTNPGLPIDELIEYANNRKGEL